MHAIELIGPSGAGKTTYASAMADSSSVFTGESGRNQCFLRTVPGGGAIARFPAPFDDAVARRLWSRRRSTYLSTYFVHNPETLESIAGIVEGADDRQHVLELVFESAAEYELYRFELGPGETVVFDDGLYQFHLRLLESGDWTAAEVVDRLPLPDRLVVFRTDPEKCVERQDNRKRGRANRFRDLDRKSLVDRLAEMLTAANDVAREVEKRGVPVQFVDDR